jgi:hypothetical protein
MKEWYCQGRSWVFVAGGSRQSRHRRRREFDSRRYLRHPHKFSHRICTNLRGPPDRRWGGPDPWTPPPPGQLRRWVLCGQRTSSVCSTQIRNKSFGSGKVKLIDAFINFKYNWYQKNNWLNRFFRLTDCIRCWRLGSEVYWGPLRMHVLQKD